VGDARLCRLPRVLGAQKDHRREKQRAPHVARPAGEGRRWRLRRLRTCAVLKGIIRTRVAAARIWSREDITSDAARAKQHHHANRDGCEPDCNSDRLRLPRPWTDPMPGFNGGNWTALASQLQIMSNAQLCVRSGALERSRRRVRLALDPRVRD
jgi:hypothetical protein